MGIFGLGRKKEVIDLAEKYRQDQERLAQQREEMGEVSTDTNAETSSSSSPLGFLGNLAGSGPTPASTETESEYTDLSSGYHEKKQKLTKRLLDMTSKIEELSNQIYHIQQRLEVLEKKTGVGKFA